MTVLVGLCDTASALERDRSILQLQHTVWLATAGAPADVWAISQTLDGWLWFGSPTGLYRFDGIRFEKVDLQQPPAMSSEVSALFATASGELLIGYVRGGMSVLRNGTFTHYRDASIMGTETVYSMTQDGSGALWAATRDRLLRFSGSKWERVAADWNYPDGYTSNVFVDRKGTLWAAGRTQVLSLAKGEHRFAPRRSTSSLTEFIESPDGRVWISSAEGLRLVSEQVLASNAPGLSPTSQASFGSFFDRDGAFWTLTPTGVSRIAYPEKLDSPALVPDVDAVATAADNYPVEWAKTMIEDREGNIWVTTQRGIHQFRNLNVVRLVLGPNEVQPRTANFARSGRLLWMASRTSSSQIRYEGDGLWKEEQGKVSRVNAELFPTANISSADRQGGAWVVASGYLWHMVDGRPIEDLQLPKEWQPFVFSGMAVDPRGTLWLAVRSHGLFRRTATGWERVEGTAQLPKEPPTALTTDQNGLVWLGYADGRVVSVADGTATQVVPPGNDLGPIISLSVRGKVLIGGENGLMTVRGGRTQVLVPDRTTAFQRVSGILELDDGDVWLNTRAGAVRIRADSILAAAGRDDGRVEVEVFDSGDGYPGESGAAAMEVNTIAQSGDGRIWVSGTYGIGWIDPKRIRHNAVPPVVLVKSVATESTRIDSSSKAMQLEAGTQRVGIAYLALSYTQPERVRFRYRLMGIDSKWVDAGFRREASYANLGPGEYMFEVQAANENGVWSHTPASVKFVIAPTFAQSWQFLVICVVSALTGAVVLVRWRIRSLLSREHARNEVRLRERERIARELHDTLLQGTQGFVWNVQGAASLLEVESPVRKLLESALVSADRVMVEGRDRILHLRTLGIEPSDLPEALEQLGHALSQGNPAHCSVTVDGECRAMRESVADEVYQIAREAMSNAFRHAKAGTVEVQLSYTQDVFRLRVRDDGIGYNAEENRGASPSGRWGVTGMRERAQAIDAELDIRSQAGVGTEVELRISSKGAYS